MTSEKAAERVRRIIRRMKVAGDRLLDLDEARAKLRDELIEVEAEARAELMALTAEARARKVEAGRPARERGWMGTISGEKFFPLDPRPEDVRIADIARGLSMTCRYAGQVKRFYSVAEHCVLVSRHVPPELALEGLLHDSAEAYIGDMIRPLKHQVEMAEFRRAEDAIERCVAERFGLKVTPEAKRAIKEIDDRILADEITALSAMPSFYLDSPLLRDKQPLGIWIVGHTPIDAERMFLERYAELTDTP